tara:strand:- start:4141 stop:4740 length:600 start_codon:yes stop_codon:yes gene_type:complete
MNKIKEILIGTNNKGKYKEICDLLPKKVKKYSLGELNILSPEETGKSFKENSFIKASYFSKKTGLICLSDDSGLEIDILKGKPGIYSSRWGGKKNNFDLAIKKVFKQISSIKTDWKKKNLTAKFVCGMTLFWPGSKSYYSEGTVKGTISSRKIGKNGFGYDPIFIPNGYKKTFGQMNPKLKMSIDHRFDAYIKLKKFFI